MHALALTHSLTFDKIDFRKFDRFVPFVEYLEEEYDPNDNDDEFYIDSILPAIKKTIASKSGVHLDDNTKYKVFKKPDNEIEVECTTSDGKVFSVEMVIDPLQQSSASPQVSIAIER